MRTMWSWGLACGVAVLVAAWLAVESRAQAPERSPLAGLWMRNHELSDPPPARGERGDRERGDDGRGRMGRGGFGGGGFGRGGRGGGGAIGNREEMARMRDALRQIMEPGERLAITQTESMVVVTDQDGRTTRLSPDGSKVKDENTRVERRSRWDSGKLVSEISGVGPGRIVQTFWIDPDARRLHITIETEGRDRQKHTVAHIYDPEAR